MTWVTGRELARQTGLTPGFISQQKKKKDYRFVFDKRRKKYDLEKTIERLDKTGAGQKSAGMKGRNYKQPNKAVKKKKSDSKRTKDEETEINKTLEADLELKRLKSENWKLKNAKEKGAAVLIEELEPVWFDMVRRTRDAVLQVSLGVSRRLVGLTAHEIQMILTEELSFALSNLPDEQPKVKG